jgi:hypothetical protein
MMGKRSDMLYDFIKSVTVPPRKWYPHNPHKIDRMFPNEPYNLFLTWCEKKGYLEEQPFSDARDFNDFFLKSLVYYDMDYEIVWCRSMYNRSRSRRKILFKRFRLNLYGSKLLAISYFQRRRRAQMKAMDKTPSRRIKNGHRTTSDRSGEEWILS